jgi:membrane fusion protein, heavy metal efflux system
MGCLGKQHDLPSHGELRTDASLLKAGVDTYQSPGKDSSQLKKEAKKYIECTGTLVIPSSNIISVAAPAGGVLKSACYSTGSYIQSGSILASIENKDFLILQQEYLEAKSQFRYFSEELKRQGELTIENASSVRKMQQAQLDYETSEIKLRSLTKQLALSGFIADSIHVDHLSSSISVKAQVSGYIDKIAIPEGHRILPGETFIVLVRNYRPVLALEIPEKYFLKLKIGQHVDFFLPGDSLATYEARLSFMPRQVSSENHLIKARATLVSVSQPLIAGMHVNARLYTGENTF